MFYGVRVSQIPSQPITRNSSLYEIFLNFISGLHITNYLFLSRFVFPLKSKSPKALERFKIPFTRSSITVPVDNYKEIKFYLQHALFSGILSLQRVYDLKTRVLHILLHIKHILNPQHLHSKAYLSKISLHSLYNLRTFFSESSHSIY